jgi:hypothetical protein
MELNSGAAPYQIDGTIRERILESSSKDIGNSSELQTIVGMVHIEPPIDTTLLSTGEMDWQ